MDEYSDLVRQRGVYTNTGRRLVVRRNDAASSPSGHLRSSAEAALEGQLFGEGYATEWDDTSDFAAVAHQLAQFYVLQQQAAAPRILPEHPFPLGLGANRGFHANPHANCSCCVGATVAPTAPTAPCVAAVSASPGKVDDVRPTSPARGRANDATSRSPTAKRRGVRSKSATTADAAARPAWNSNAKVRVRDAPGELTEFLGPGRQFDARQRRPPRRRRRSPARTHDDDAEPQPDFQDSHQAHAGASAVGTTTHAAAMPANAQAQAQAHAHASSDEAAGEAASVAIAAATAAAAAATAAAQAASAAAAAATSAAASSTAMPPWLTNASVGGEAGQAPTAPLYAAARPRRDRRGERPSRIPVSAASSVETTFHAVSTRRRSEDSVGRQRSRLPRHRDGRSDDRLGGYPASREHDSVARHAHTEDHHRHQERLDSTTRHQAGEAAMPSRDGAWRYKDKPTESNASPTRPTATRAPERAFTPRSYDSEERMAPFTAQTALTDSWQAEVSFRADQVQARHQLDLARSIGVGQHLQSVTSGTQDSLHGSVSASEQIAAARSAASKSHKVKTSNNSAASSSRVEAQRQLDLARSLMATADDAGSVRREALDSPHDSVSAAEQIAAARRTTSDSPHNPKTKKNSKSASTREGRRKVDLARSLMTTADDAGSVRSEALDSPHDSVSAAEQIAAARKAASNPHKAKTSSNKAASRSTAASAQARREVDLARSLGTRPEMEGKKEDEDDDGAAGNTPTPPQNTLSAAEQIAAARRARSKPQETVEKTSKFSAVAHAKARLEMDVARSLAHVPEGAAVSAAQQILAARRASA